MDACKPGDRVSIVGVYKAVPPAANGSISGQFRAVVVASNVKRMVRDAGELERLLDTMGAACSHTGASGQGVPAFP